MSIANGAVARDELAPTYKALTRPLVPSLRELRKKIIAARKELEQLVREYSTYQRLLLLGEARGETAGESGAPLDLPRFHALDLPWEFPDDLPELQPHGHVKINGSIDWPEILSRAPRTFTVRDIAGQYGLELKKVYGSLWYHTKVGCLRRLAPGLYERVGRPRARRPLSASKLRTLAATVK